MKGVKGGVSIVVIVIFVFVLLFSLALTAYYFALSEIERQELQILIDDCGHVRAELDVEFAEEGENGLCITKGDDIVVPVHNTGERIVTDWEIVAVVGNEVLRQRYSWRNNEEDITTESLIPEEKRTYTFPLGTDIFRSPELKSLEILPVVEGKNSSQPILCPPKLIYKNVKSLNYSHIVWDVNINDTLKKIPSCKE